MNLPSQSSELRTRVYTASILAITIIALCALANAVPGTKWILAAVAFLAAGMAAGEYSLISNDHQLTGVRYWCFLLVNLGALGACFICGLTMPPATLIPLLLLVTTLATSISFLIVAVYERGEIEGSVSSWAEYSAGVALLTLGGGALITLIFGAGGITLCLWLLIVVCFNDISAFFTGRLVGGPLLAPTVSPKKTFSGSLGGFIGGTLVGVIFGALLYRPFSPFISAAVALMVVCAAQAGDLLKSLLKRRHNLKDSGDLLPGHGGVLDRIDGILLAAPVAVASQMIIQSIF